MSRDRWLIALIGLVATGSFLIETWPLSIAGVIALAFVGRGFLAVPLGFLFDLAFGAPTGLAMYAFFPFTIIALAVLALRYGARGHFLNRASRDTL